MWCGTLIFLLSWTQVNSETADESLEAKLDALIEPYLAVNDFAGAVLVARGKEILVKKAYGFANLEWSIPNTPSTKFHIASMSKPFTATAVMVLVDRGKLELQKPIESYLPGYPRGKEITVHHLLTHSSGIPDYNDFPDYHRFKLTDHTLAETVAWFKDKPLQAEPGAKHRYSNANFVLLAHLVEVVTGKPFDLFLKEAIFDVAGMKDSGNFTYEQVIPNRSDGYEPGPGNSLVRAEWYSKSFKVGSGALYSTVEDLYHFVRALKDGKILKQSSLDAMWMRQISHYGYGWGIGEGKGVLVVGHDGSSPGYFGEMSFDLKSETFVVFLANIRTGISRQLGNALLYTAFGRDYPLPPPPVYVSDNPDQFEALTGEYWFPFEQGGNPFTIYRQGDRLFFHWGEVVEGKLHGSILHAIGPNSFVNRSRYDRLTFVLDHEGKAEAVLYSENQNETRCPRRERQDR